MISVGDPLRAIGAAATLSCASEIMGGRDKPDHDGREL